MASALERFEFSDDEFDDARLTKIKWSRGEYVGAKIQYLEELKRMLTDVSGFRPCLEDNFLLRFLKGTKYRLDSVMKSLKTYYFNRRAHPEIFQDYLPSNTLRAQALNHIKALPYRAKNLSLVVLIKLDIFQSTEQADFQKVPFLELLRLELMVFETLMQNPVTQLTGITLIVDCDGFSPAAISEITTCLPACYDVFHHDCMLGIKYLHVINTPALLHLLYLNILPSFPEDQHCQVMFYSPGSELEELHNQVSPEYLPTEYGGNLPSTSLVDLNPLVNMNEDYFREQMKYGVPKDEIELD